MIELNALWFLLITVLFIGFFFLEGFDYGVGILLPFLGKTDRERRQIINTIGPVWDGNEVWMITAGGAMFAAFPNWYATLFSGFYLALVLMLVALIVRGVAFEFRSKQPGLKWRQWWDRAIFFGSAVPALLWGVALANLVRGVPIDENMIFTGNLLTLLNPYALLGGLVSLSIWTLHGAIFLALKTDGPVRERAEAVTKRVGPVATVLVVLLVAFTYFETDILTTQGVVPPITAVGAGAALLATGWMVNDKRFGWGFILMGVHIALTTITAFNGLFPRVMISSLNPEWSLTIYNSASSEYTLQIMTVVALILVPIVLVYQSWTYWIFRKRITTESKLEY
ncbi:MAG: cytochrome d ubiquinol oxidase subunit II [Anaerolineae bacterium]